MWDMVCVRDWSAGNMFSSLGQWGVQNISYHHNYLDYRAIWHQRSSPFDFPAQNNLPSTSQHKIISIFARFGLLYASFRVPWCYVCPGLWREMKSVTNTTQDISRYLMLSRFLADTSSIRSTWTLSRMGQDHFNNHFVTLMNFPLLQVLNMMGQCVIRVVNSRSMGSDGSVENVQTMICVLCAITVINIISDIDFTE